MNPNAFEKHYEHIVEIDGVQAFITFMTGGGQKITISGFRRDHSKFKQGQRCVVVLPEGRSSRYKIKTIDRPGDPGDQYFMNCVFDPSPEPK